MRHFIVHRVPLVAWHRDKSTDCRKSTELTTEHRPQTKPDRGGNSDGRRNETTVLIRSDIGQTALDLTASRPFSSHCDNYSTASSTAIGHKGTPRAGISATEGGCEVWQDNETTTAGRRTLLTAHHLLSNIFTDTVSLRYRTAVKRPRVRTLGLILRVKTIEVSKTWSLFWCCVIIGKTAKM